MVSRSKMLEDQTAGHDPQEVMAAGVAERGARVMRSCMMQTRLCFFSGLIDRQDSNVLKTGLGGWLSYISYSSEVYIPGR